MRIATTVCMLLLALGTRAQNAPPAAVDGITGIVHSRRLASGVPLGGIGTGTLQLMTDGAISGATINNNWAYPMRDLPGCFAAVRTRSGTRTASRVLALTSSYGLPTVHGLDYGGLYPTAKLAFADAELPISISLRAFSPLIPHDVRNSSFPAAAFLYRLQNMSAGEVEVSIALAWENTLGVGGTATTGPFDNRTGNGVASVPDADGFFAQRFTRGLDSGTTEDVKLRNNSSGDMTLMAAPQQPHAIVTTAVWNALDMKPAWWDGFGQDGSVHGSLGAGVTGQIHPAGVICVHVLLRPRETVDLPFAVAWYTPHLNTVEGGDYGHYYQTLWPDSYAAARGLLTEWHSLLAMTEEWQQRILFSNLPKWMARRLINSVSPITTHSIFTRDESFAMLDDIAIAGPLPPSKTQPSAATANGSPQVSSFGLGSKPILPGTRLTSLTHRLVISGLLTDFFPILSARELRLFMARQAAEGTVPTSLGDIERMIGVPQAGSLAAVEQALVLSNGPRAPLNSLEAVDDTSAFLLQIAQYVFRTGDREFLHVYFGNIRSALTILLNNSVADGLPTLASGTINPASASLFLGALQAGTRLCRLSGSQAYMDMRLRGRLESVIEAAERSNRKAEDEALGRRCDDARKRAAEAIERRFWNGQIYAERSASGSEFSMVDQLMGIAYSDRLGGQGPTEANQLDLLPGTNIVTALANIQRLNDQKSPQLPGPLARAPFDGSVTVANSDRICDLGATVLGYASLLLTRRQPEIAVSLLRRLDEARNNLLLSPWQSPSRFWIDKGADQPLAGASLAQAVDWNVLAPLEGVAIDLGVGQLSLSPQIPGNWRSLSAPIFAPTFWGRLEFRPTARGGVTSLRIDRLIALPAATASRRLSGSAGLLLTRIRIPGPPERPGNAPAAELPVAHVSRGTAPLGVTTTRDRSGDFILIFETPVMLTAGDRLEIDLH